MEVDQGPIYTKGRSFRARAEARQRAYRAAELRAGCSTWGHWLDDAAASAGANFVVPEAFEAVRGRMAQGKGVDPRRTLTNMLSSQAMCFNVFTPLALDSDLAFRILRRFVPCLSSVRSVAFEHTPAKDIFNDQSGRGGVDCDVLVECEFGDGVATVLTLETKFVEEEFSSCGFRKPGRQAKGQRVCPRDVKLTGDFSGCLYTSAKGYRYWQRTQELGNLQVHALPSTGCPFGGPLWQLWVNHTLAGAEAGRRASTRFAFGVCAPAGNDALLDGGRVLADFRSHLTDPSSLVFADLDSVIGAIREECDGRTAWHDRWYRGLAGRYAAI